MKKKRATASSTRGYNSRGNNSANAYLESDNNYS